MPCLMLTLISSLSAQSKMPSGTYGALFTVQFMDQDDNNGGAILALLNLDGAGNITGTYTIQVRDHGGTTATGNLTGTYSVNPDGTGTATVSVDIGFTSTFALVVTDGGKGIQFVSTGSNSGFNGGDATFQGSAQSLTGSLPIEPYLNGGTGGISLSFTGSTPANSGVTIYSAAAAAGNGTATCPDGSSGSWNASVPNFSIVTRPAVPALSSAGGPIATGSFFGTVSVSGCGGGDLQIITGPISGTIRPGGAASITIHKVADVLSGVAHAAAPGVSVNGSYGLQGSYAPYPQGTVGVVSLDGSGNLTGTLTVENGQSNSSAPPQPVNFLGTYSLNPDGTGTIATKLPSGQPGPTFAFIVTDGGSGILLLQTTLTGTGDIGVATARLQ
jgi:hypothetical protein